MADILSLVGLAKKAGKLEVGEEPVGAVCRARKAHLVLLASDAASNTARRAAHFGQAGKTLWITLPCSKSALGAAVGHTSCAMAAVTDAGFAAAIAQKLASDDPGSFGPAAEQLSRKADKVYERQKERRLHEKRLKQLREKPWAAPPANKASGHKSEHKGASAPRSPDTLKKPERPKPPKSKAAPSKKTPPVS